MNKIILNLISALICLLSLPLHATVKIGTVFFYPPFVLSPGSGFDVDLSKALCQRLALECEFNSMNFNALFPALAKKQIDIAIGGIPISNEKGQFIFSLPYMLSKGQFLVLQNSPLQSIDDIQNKIIGVIRGEGTGGLFYNYLLGHFPGQNQIILYDDMEDIITALSEHTIAAALMHRATAIYWEQNTTNKFRELGESMFIGKGIGMVALPENQALIDAINKELIIMENDKTYLSLYATYFANE